MGHRTATNQQRREQGQRPPPQDHTGPTEVGQTDQQIYNSYDIITLLPPHSSGSLRDNVLNRNVRRVGSRDIQRRAKTRWNSVDDEDCMKSSIAQKLVCRIPFYLSMKSNAHGPSSPAALDKAAPHDHHPQSHSIPGDSPSQAKDHLSKILLQRLITTIAQSPSSEGPPSRPVRLLRNSARMTPTRTGLLLTTVQ
eukprot:g12788.t1